MRRIKVFDFPLGVSGVDGTYMIDVIKKFLEQENADLIEFERHNAPKHMYYTIVYEIKKER